MVTVPLLHFAAAQSETITSTWQRWVAEAGPWTLYYTPLRLDGLCWFLIQQDVGSTFHNALTAMNYTMPVLLWCVEAVSQNKTLLP